MNLNERLHENALEDYIGKRDKKIKRTDNGFNELGINSKLLKGVEHLKFKNPTPIQHKTIPVAIKGEDIIALAQTGSGKTLSFGIPMIQRLVKLKRNIGLVLVPTRELALQVEESLQIFCRSTHLRSVVLIGGASMSMQRVALKKNPRVIIATPGRLMDHVERKTINLSSVAVFVLDEADRMLDMGFIPDIKKIIKSIPEKRQTMLFSATMPNEIRKIAEELMDDPIRIEVNQSGSIPHEISHEMFFIKNQDKSRLLAVHLKESTGPVLVFTRTKRMASKLKTKITKMGFLASEIHSDRSQGQRRNALEGFKRGKYNILIATDIAARGIDVSGIEMVVNYDMPANSEDYVHRIGRTGRAGKSGHAVSFANLSQKNTIRSLERVIKTKMTISKLPFLPSEEKLIKDGEYLGLSNNPETEQKQINRNYKKRTKSTRNQKSIVSRRQPRSSEDAPKNDSKDKKPFWTKFKKKRTPKIKKVGNGSRRRSKAKT